MYKREKTYLLVIMLFFATFFVLNLQNNERVRLYPSIVCGVGFALTAIKMAITIYEEKKQRAIETSKPLTKKQLLSLLITLAASTAYVILIPILGYFVSTFLFVVLFSYWHTSTKPKWQYLVVGLVVDAVIFVAFKLFLNLPLPKGFLI